MPAGASTSVVVVNWNGGALLLECLRSLAGDAAGRSDVELVLVDNASQDGSVEQAQQLVAGLRVVRRPTNEGFAAGANAGIRASTGDFVVLVNNDARVEPGFLEAVVAPMVEPGGEDVAAVTGRVLLAGRFRPAPPGTPPEEGLTAADGRRWVRTGGEDGVRLVNSTGNVVTASGNGRDRDWLAADDGPAAPADVFGFNGGCVALRRRALDEVGLFDERLFMYYEDTELSWRLRRAGWRIVHAPRARTVHRHAASSGTATAFFQVHNTRNRLVVAAAQAPWPVLVRALVRTLARLVRGPHRGRTGRALLQAAAMAPAALATRRATDRSARVARREVARGLVAD
ncbi:glycosyltransferase family 2 protein [Geodermatophilus sp. SYSU D00815]